MIDKITIAVDAMKQMVAFYSAVLGVKFSERKLFKRTLCGASFGDIELLFCPKDLAGVRADVNTIQVRFVVPDSRLCAGLNHGAVSITEPAVLDGSLQASLRDPDGNLMELKERVG